ncbi:MSMEG_0570 family nitrogen starvation response protein [Fulvimarina sp. MAC8]|uniref:MSMEG_0570 family nitrogen starvation response protein n=1 Tax=Fulvimarina sp. MAC8 TaxID=3162874 RepID=UPI0032EB42B4
MPEVNFILRWPDGEEERCYSPSTTIKEFLKAGETYPLATFLERARGGLNKASARVEERYGFACSSAMDQLKRIEARAADFAARDDATVELVSIIEGAR